MTGAVLAITVRKRSPDRWKRAGKAETGFVVPVVRRVPVAVRGPEPVRIVVPGPAAKNTGRGRPGFRDLAVP